MVTFVDRVTLHLRAGKGGNGCVSVRREKFKPLAGPDLLVAAQSIGLPVIDVVVRTTSPSLRPAVPVQRVPVGQPLVPASARVAFEAALASLRDTAGPSGMDQVRPPLASGKGHLEDPPATGSGHTAAAVVETLRPIQTRFAELESDPAETARLLA